MNWNLKIIYENENLLEEDIKKFLENEKINARMLKHFEIDIYDIKKAFEIMSAVDGRFNLFLVSGVKVIVDYAHTPDGLENLLKAALELKENKKLIILFGCGGNREVQKRAKMGEISSKYADFVIISTDNPRFESREKIAREIEKGLTHSNYLIELDRSFAIKKGFEMANIGDVFVIAGKGAEKYIDENGIKTPYSDFDEVEKYRRF